MTSYIKATLSVWHSYGTFTGSGQIGEGVFDSKKQAASLDNDVHYNRTTSSCWKHLPMTNTHTHTHRFLYFYTCKDPPSHSHNNTFCKPLTLTLHTPNVSSQHDIRTDSTCHVFNFSGVILLH